MAEFEFLKSLVIIFGVSAAVVFILGKFKVPSIIGFLIAGGMLGPYGLELIKDVHLVEIFAEIGVVLLLFTIGLEFSLKGLLALKKTIFVGGFLQVFITALIVYGLSMLTGYEMNTSVVLGGLIALSSTAIVLKLLFDKAEIDSPHGRVSLGILIFQDFCVVLFILLIPLLKEGQGNITDLFLVLAQSIVFVIAVIVTARWVVPNALHQIVHTRMRELFIISIIFICLGAAYLTYTLGFSLALGAFIAGLVISESEYSYQAISDILPFKDSFNGLFFISVGMLMNINYFYSHVGTVFTVVCLIIVLKAVTSSIAVFITGSNLRVSLHSGLLLAHIGEFSFVLAITALRADIITENIYQLFLSSAIVTMVLVPLFVAISPTVSTWVTSRNVFSKFRERQAHERISSEFDRKTDHVIIIGFGVNGKNVSLVLKELEVPYVILELNNQTVTQERNKGEPIVYGDGTSQEILHKLGIERARVLVVSVPDPSATRKIVKTARAMNAGILIVVRTRFLAEVDDLHYIGADEVVPAEFETSIELFSRILQFYNMPRTLIGKYADKFRQNHYKLFIRGETPKRLFQDTIALMPEVNYESFEVESGSDAVDSSIRELDIQNKTGANVIAVRRENQTMMGLNANFTFQPGDFVFLIGDKSALKEANRRFFCAIKT